MIILTSENKGASIPLPFKNRKRDTDNIFSQALMSLCQSVLQFSQTKHNTPILVILSSIDTRYEFCLLSQRPKDLQLKVKTLTYILVDLITTNLLACKLYEVTGKTYERGSRKEKETMLNGIPYEECYTKVINLD